MRSAFVVVLCLLTVACGGSAPVGSAAGAPTGGTVTATPGGSSGASAVPASTPDPALVAALSAEGLALDEVAFLAATTFEATPAGTGAAKVVEHLASGDTVEFTVVITPTDGAPGLVAATSTTTIERIDVHLEYVVSAAGMSAEVRESLAEIATAARMVASIKGGPLVAADVTAFGVTVDWAIKKVESTLRDSAIKDFLSAVAPEKAGPIIKLFKAGLTAEKGLKLSDKLDAQLAELDKLEDCARNPSNPLTIKQYEQEPGARDRVLDQIAEARRELIANTIVMQLGVLNGYGASAGPKWLGYAIGPGTAWSKATLEKLNQERLDEIKRTVPKCECALVTQGVDDPLTWLGKRTDPASEEWLIQGKTKAAGYDETFLYRAVIDPAGTQGSYKYEAIGSIASGTITKNGAGTVNMVRQADGSVILTFSPINVKGVITAGGTTQSVNLPIPETAFTWKLVGGAGCGG